MKRALILAGLATICVAAPADARPTRLQRAVQIADSYYPNSPCHGKETVVGVTGAYLESAIDPANQDRAIATGGAIPGTCSVVVVWDRWQAWEPWREVCRMLVHEFGHLAGLEHSPDPRSPMYYALSDLNTGSWRCTKAFGWAVYDR